MMGWYNDGSWGWGSWLTMIMFMVAFWGLVIFAIVAIFRGTSAKNSDRTPDRDPLRVLDERFARGEIDEDEYHARAEVLRGARSTPSRQR